MNNVIWKGVAKTFIYYSFIYYAMLLIFISITFQFNTLSSTSNEMQVCIDCFVFLSITFHTTAEKHF